MTRPDADRAFQGSIPDLYAQHLVPMFFDPYAAALATHVAARRPARVLEIAAGTGALTRRLATALPPGASLVATDLNRPMLDVAARTGTARPVEWREADAQRLPFADAEFDAVVCQFGVMFFPDRPAAFREARRVLGAGGVLTFSTWDRIEENEFAHTVSLAVASLFPADPPRFIERTPHGYHEVRAIRSDLRLAGFASAPHVVTRADRSTAASARVPALAFCQGTPLRHEIEARDPSRLEEATDVAAAALARRFGSGPIEGRMSAHLVDVGRG